MVSKSLREFIAHTEEDRRIRFGDLKRLQRDILPARITTREEAEMLIGLDRTIERADRDWSAYLIRTVKDFVVWGMNPSGSVDRDKAEWLIEVLSRSGVTRTGRIIAREVAWVASPVNEALIALASVSRRRPAGNGETDDQAGRRGAEPLDSLSRRYPLPVVAGAPTSAGLCQSS